VGTLKAALISVGKPGQASAAAIQRLAEFGIYHDLQMTLQEAHHVTLCPQWKIVLQAMIQSRWNELQSKAIKQDCWNNREANKLRMAWVMTYLLPVIATRRFSLRLRTSDNGNRATDR